MEKDQYVRERAKLRNMLLLVDLLIWVVIAMTVAGFSFSLVHNSRVLKDRQKLERDLKTCIELTTQ